MLILRDQESSKSIQSEHMNNLKIIAPLPAITIRTRLVKLAKLLNERGSSVSHWGWSRKDGDTAETLPFDLHEKVVMLRTHTNSVRLHYPRWTLAVFFRLLRSKEDQTLYCLGLESAVAAWAASKFKKIEYIFDDADRLVLILKLPSPLQQIIRWVEIKVSRSSLAHIIPGEARYDYSSSKFVIVKNTPTSSDIRDAANESTPPKPGRFVVYVNGWLGETRGLPIALYAATKLLSNKNIVFIAAGRIDGPSAEAFVNLENVNYFGEVSSSKSLALYNISDVVLTLYDPSIEINSYAESNKWGDAMVTATPVVVNSEVKTAEFLRTSGAAFSAPYSDPDAFVDIFVELSESENMIKAAKDRLVILSKNTKPFDSVMNRVLEQHLE